MQKILTMSKIGRNAPCPCGSGKKYKKCCLLNQDGRSTSVPPIKYRAVYTDLDQLSNSVVDLINQNELEKAEALEAPEIVTPDFKTTVDDTEWRG